MGRGGQTIEGQIENRRPGAASFRDLVGKLGGGRGRHNGGQISAVVAAGVPSSV